eukprot:COSAG03_NODE_81_length_14000_cov_112.534206_5_plen_228_part_00
MSCLDGHLLVNFIPHLGRLPSGPWLDRRAASARREAARAPRAGSWAGPCVRGRPGSPAGGGHTVTIIRRKARTRRDSDEADGGPGAGARSAQLARPHLPGSCAQVLQVFLSLSVSLPFSLLFRLPPALSLSRAPILGGRFCDHTAPVSERVADLLPRLNLTEKIGQTGMVATAVPQWGMQECLLLPISPSGPHRPLFGLEHRAQFSALGAGTTLAGKPCTASGPAAS